MTERPILPDLSGLPRVTPSLGAKVVIGDMPSDHQICGLVTNFVRLVDFAIVEYELGRTSIGAFWSTSNTLAISRPLLASGHFETCISTTKRIIDHVKAIRSHPTVSPQMKGAFPRGMITLRGNVEKKVTTIRDKIQHGEGQWYVSRGETLPAVQKGQPYLLACKETELVLGRLNVQYTELAAWLRELHTCAEALVQATHLM